MLGYTTLMINS